MKPLYENFLSERQEYLKRLHSGSPASVAGYSFTADLTTFAAPILPLEVLANLVLQKLNPPGKPTALVPMIQNAASGLKNAIAKRDEVIARFNSGEISDSDRHWYYFGEKTLAGSQNREYSDIVEVIHSYTDDLIYFSASLCDALVIHGQRIRSSVKESPRNLPRVHAPDFIGPKKSGLFPPDSDYGSFQAWIVEREPSPESRRGVSSLRFWRFMRPAGMHANDRNKVA